jgi:Family of unknown function (DUF5670)
MAGKSFDKSRLAERTAPGDVMPNPSHRQEIDMIWTIIGILFLLWLAGFAFHVAGGLIHILLVVAVVLIIYRLITGRSAV